MKTKSQSFDKEKDALLQRISALQKENEEKSSAIQDLQSRKAFQPPPPSCPPPVTKPMCQHNARVDSDSSTKDLGQQLISLRETNKSLTDRVRQLREDKAKLQREIEKKDEQYREMSDKYRRVSSLQRANAAVSKLKVPRPKSRSSTIAK